MQDIFALQQIQILSLIVVMIIVIMILIILLPSTFDTFKQVHSLFKHEISPERLQPRLDNSISIVV
jgi:hypothetical protein